MDESKPLTFLSRGLGWGLAVGIGLTVASNWRPSGTSQPALSHALSPSPPIGEALRGPLVELVSDTSETFRLTGPDAAKILGLKLAEVRPAPPPEPLRLPGSLFLDPNRLVHVHSRFTGEAVTIGEVVDGTQKRPLRYGDPVVEGQILAVVWSKEIGEKKSELVDALSRLDISQAVLQRLESLEKGVTTEQVLLVLLEARRAAEADQIAVTRVERTLRSWRLTNEEIDVVRREFHDLQKRQESQDVTVERDWAEMEVRAAIDGVIVEKNFNVGDIVDPQDDIFKIADLSRLQVLANVYEEDLWAIRDLAPEDRRWSIDLKSDPSDNRISGTFRLIGNVLDRAQRTGVVMGWLDNRESSMLVGQFITATVELPAGPNIMAIPEEALLEEGDSSSVMVETNAERHEFTRRRVVVVRRCIGMVYVDGRPPSSDAEPLRIGERVVIQGALGLGAELANLRAANPLRS